MLSLLGTEIGRGHPCYLDGVHRALIAAGHGDAITRRSDVFAASHGVSRLAWRAVRAAYRLGGSGGPVSTLYHRARAGADYDRDSRLLDALGRDVRAWAGDSGRVVVDHAALVGALGDRADVWYLHGEMIAPPEAIVRRAAATLVPTSEVADAFVRGGVARERVHVTGICIENELVANAAAAAAARLERLADRGAQRLGLFSSGAEPRAHVATLVAAAQACARAGHQIVVVAAAGGRLARAVRRTLGDRVGAVASPAVVLVEFSGRDELDRRTADLLPAIDVVLSPPHERSNWAVGLGIPFFLVGPDIGPFAPLNRALLLRTGVAMELHDRAAAEQLPDTLRELAERGLLTKMAHKGSGPPIDGFANAARRLIEPPGVADA